MLPTPEQCWLADADGNHYVSELRMVAVDTVNSIGGGGGIRTHESRTE